MAPSKRVAGKRSGTSYRVRVARSGLELEVEGDHGFIEEMLARFDVLTKQGSAPQKGSPVEKSTGSRSASTASKALSVSEFVRILPFKKHTDLVLGFGYYLEKYRDMKEFTAADINNCYYEAKLDTSNTSQMIIQNIKRGYMMEGKGGSSARRAYTLTRSGEGQVAANIQPDEK